jgi:hypothetical protein
MTIFAASTNRGRASSIGIDQRDLLRHADRIVPRQHDDRGAEVEALRPAGVIREQVRRRRRHRVPGEVVLECPQRIEAERLGQIAERHVLREYRRVGAAFLLQHVERHSDFHECLPFEARSAGSRCPSIAEIAAAVAFTSVAS